MIRKYEYLCGKGSVIVRIYDRNKFCGSDVVEDFLKIIGVESDLSVFNLLPVHNQRLSVRYLQFKRQCNALPLNQEESWLLSKEIISLSSKAREKILHYLPCSIRNEIMEICLEENEITALEYLGVTVAEMFDDLHIEAKDNVIELKNLTDADEEAILDELSPECRQIICQAAALSVTVGLPKIPRNKENVWRLLRIRSERLLSRRLDSLGKRVAQLEARILA